jgi:hypothetical protein
MLQSVEMAVVVRVGTLTVLNIALLEQPTRVAVVEAEVVVTPIGLVLQAVLA